MFVAVVVGLAVLLHEGSSQECARNGFGATFCGQELTEYREHLAKAEHEGQAAARSFERAADEARKQQSEAERSVGQAE